MFHTLHRKCFYTKILKYSEEQAIAQANPIELLFESFYKDFFQKWQDVQFLTIFNNFSLQYVLNNKCYRNC